MKKRILSMLLAIVMVVGLLPTAVFAAEGDNLCDHHTEHTADCGYAPAVEGSPCTHECGEECAEACTHVHDEACGYVEAAAEVPCGYVCEESHGEATRVIYVDESTFLASGYSRFYDADNNLLTATREEQEDGWVKYTMPADAKYYLTFDGHLGGGGGDNYPELPTDADRYDPSSDFWSCSHPGYAEGTCTLCGKPCPGHTYDNACDAECNVCSEIREVGDHVYDGAEDAECNECGYVRDITPVQITGVSITVDGVLYTEGNVTITLNSNVILTITGTNLQNGTDDHRVDYAGGIYQPVTPDYFEISEDGTVATYEPSTGDFANSSNFEITYCNNDTDTANRTVVPTGIYLTYDDGIAEENRARITGMSITIDNVVYDSSNTSAEDPAVITPNTEFITITVHGTAMQNCTTDHMVSYYSGSSQPILANNLWHFEADGTSAYHYYSSADALSDFARNTTPYELQYSNNGSFNAANPAIGSGVYIVYDDGTGDEEPASCTCVTKCAEGSVNSECAVCSVEGADLSGCVGEEATADDEVKQTYAITVNASQNGSVIADEYAIEGDTVTLYVSPYLGYVLDTLSVTDAEGNAVTVENNQFTMPASAVTVSAAFVVCDHKDSQYKYYDNGDGYHDATCTACHDGSLEPHTIDSTTGECEKCGAKCTHNNFDSATGNCADCKISLAIAKVETGETTTYYQTAEELSTAVRSDLADQTITLLADFAVITDLKFNSDSEAKNTLDLNGHTIYSDYSARIAVYCGELTITGIGSIDVFMTANDESAKIVVGSRVTLNDTLRSVYGGVLDLSNATIPEAGLNVILYSDDYMPATYNVSDVLLLPEDYYFFVDGKVVSSYSVETEGTVLKHTEHSYTYTDNGDGTHDAICSACDAVVDNEAHSGGTATCTELAECQHCGASYGEVDADAHSYGDWVSNGDDTHTRICANDSSHTENGDCSGGTATCTTLAVCDTCGASYGEVNANNHNWENGVCTYECGTTHDPHTFENGICTVCGKEDTTPAEITGVSITVDSVTYTSGDVTITPETESIIVTVTGTNFANLSGDHELDLGSGLTIFLNTWRWEIDSDANTATADFSDLNSEFVDHNGYEITYSNGGGQGFTGTGIYLTYDDGIAEEDKAQITGVSITVDGDTYTSGNVTITPTSTITLTVTGTNLQNGTGDNKVEYAYGAGDSVEPDWFEINEDGTVATFAPPVSFFANSSNFEIKYYNNYTDTENRTAISTGIYLTYDDGIEVNTTLAIGDNEITDGDTYTYTAEQDGSLYITVAELNYRGIGEVDEENLGNWCAIEINGTAITDFVNSIEVKTGDTVTVELVSLDKDTYNGTINLSWDASVMAEITGVSITVDGETYTSGNVTIHPVSTVTLTVTGTSLQNSTGDNRVDYAYGLEFPVKLDSFKISEDGTIATYTIHAKAFVGSSSFEIKYYNNYSDSANRTAVSTSICLTYDETLPDASGKLIVDMGDLRGDGWSGAAIQIYKNGSLETTVTVGDGKAFNTVFLDYDSTATYEIKWVEGSSDSQCSFNIYVDGEEKRSVANAYALEAGETLWSQGDIGGEEDPNTFTVTLDDNIEGGTISVDSPTYTVGDRVIVKAHPDEGYVLDKVIATNTTTGESLPISGTAFEMPAAPVNVTAIFIKGYDLEIIFDDGGNTVDFPPSADEGETVTVKFTAKEGFELQLVNVIEDTSRQPVPHEMVDDNTFTFLMPAGEVTIYFSFWQIGTDLETIYYKGPWTNMQVNFLNDGSDIGAPNGVLTWVEEGIYAITDIPAHTSQLAIINMDTNETVTIKSIPTDGSDLYNADTGAWETYVPSAQITGVSIVIDGEEYVGSDTSAENPAVITSEAASVILTVHGTNLQYATDEQWVSYMSTGNCVTLDNSDWTKSEDGSLASLDLTFLTESFIQSISVWEIKYSSNGGGLEDAVTGLYVKYEHIPEEEPIVIIQQPTDGEAKLGERYCVEVIAQGEGLTYQWYFRNEGSTAWYKSSVTDNTYDDVMTTARMNREVYCVITDSHGNSVTTETAKLIALKSVDLAITKEPESVTANYGERFTVTAEAVGDGVTYVWYYLDPDGASWLSTNVRSATYSATMSEKIDGRAVYCVATDIWGEMVATGTVRLSCERAELAITQQPANASAKLDEMFNVEFFAEGDGLKYQWYWRTKGQENWNVSGQRDNSYDDVMTSARHNREVYCVITDAWGDSVTTDIATITGTAAVELAITRQPESQTVTIGDMFNVTFDAVGDGLKYQWYFRQAGTEVWYTSGQRDNSYDDVMTKARHNRELYCVVTDAWGNTVETSPVVVIKAAPRHELAITAQPENESVKMGEMFCVTVEAQGDELKYQWYWRNVGSENWNVSGQRDNTYDDVMTKARHNREVKCVITDMWGNSVETGIATITGIPTQTLAITQQPINGQARMGEGYFVEVIAQGDGLTYQWYFKNAGTDVWHVSGVKDNTYDDVMIESRAGRQVYCVITDIWGNTVTTETVTLVCTEEPQAIAMN